MGSAIGCLGMACGLILLFLVLLAVAGDAGGLILFGLFVTWLGHHLRRPRRKAGWTRG